MQYHICSCGKQIYKYDDQHRCIKCTLCNGTGIVVDEKFDPEKGKMEYIDNPCPTCNGVGRIIIR